MIDYFALALTHGLLVLVALRLLQRDDLDVEQLDEAAKRNDPPAPPPGPHDRFKLPPRGAPGGRPRA
ncbi:hypothetical protein [Novosphingobium sp.]|uniref:hypothetical protein n=1 Tax=Novosphingobium sp. TaxID=1874826 RepID=UPI0035B3E028